MFLTPEDRRERSSIERRHGRLTLPEIFAGSAAVGLVLTLGYHALGVSSATPVAPATPAPRALAVAEPVEPSIAPVDEVPAGIDVADEPAPPVAAPAPVPAARPRRVAARPRASAPAEGDLDAIVRRAAEVEALQGGGG